MRAQPPRGQRPHRVPPPSPPRGLAHGRVQRVEPPTTMRCRPAQHANMRQLTTTPARPPRPATLANGTGHAAAAAGAQGRRRVLRRLPQLLLARDALQRPRPRGAVGAAGHLRRLHRRGDGARADDEHRGRPRRRAGAPQLRHDRRRRRAVPAAVVPQQRGLPALAGGRRPLQELLLARKVGGARGRGQPAVVRRDRRRRGGPRPGAREDHVADGRARGARARAWFL